ncbi:MAG: OmpA family protein, partial [Bacteroidia bacterium]|nr:OmpA family protein [Bacteroidia bacterium]
LTTYAHVKLDRTLRVGKKYRVSIQSYFPERSNYKSTIHSRTGIKLFNKEINTNNVGVIYTDNFLALDQLTTNKWNKSEWIIAPLCELNYLTVGFFSNDDVSNEIFHHFSNNWVRYYYFIDDIRVEEYEGDEEFVHYDCYDERQVNIRSGLKDSLILLFDQSEFILETEHKDQLDSFYQKLIAHPHLTINIIGNADSYGSYNYKLSSARASEVLDYMLSKGSVSKERFNVKAAGDENAILEIGENEKNQKFRNVTIFFSELTIEEKIYRQIIKSLINGKDVQFNKYLNIYNHITEVEESIHLLFDPRIKDKLSDEQRSLISEKIKKENGIVSFFLDSMYIEDQYDRTYQFKLNSLTGFHEFDQNENQYNVELVTRNNDDRNLSLILK